MVLELMDILFTTFAMLAMAVYLGIVHLLILRFWFIAVIVGEFLCLLYMSRREMQVFYSN